VKASKPHHPRLPHRGRRAAPPPDIIKIGGLKNVLPSSPIRPAVHRNTIDEQSRHADGCVHTLDPSIAGIWHSRKPLRKETIAAEDILPDLGALSICPRIRKPWAGSAKSSSGPGQSADKMKKQRGSFAETKGNNDNSASSATSRNTPSIRRLRHGVFEADRLGGKGQARRPRLWSPASSA